MTSRILTRKKEWYSLAICGIVVLTVFLRFVNYENRFGLAYDQAHDAIIARFALENNKLPLVGPFSSAGAFQTGGEWYWFVMLGMMSLPFSVLSPWIYLTVLSVIFVYLLIRFGEELVDKKFGLIVGLLAAVSYAQNSQSVNLTNQSPLALISLLALFAMLRFLRTQERFYLFFFGFFVSLGATIHLQGVALFLLLFMTFISFRLRPKRHVPILFLGILLPFTPIAIFDIQNGFINTRNMIEYFFFNENKIPYEALGRRWLTYVTDFWPRSWAAIIGGHTIMGAFILLGLGLSILLGLFQKRITREWFIVFGTLLGSVVLLRYVRTPLFDSYLVFLHPFVFLGTAFVIYTFLHKKLIGIVSGLVIVGLSLLGTIRYVIESESYTPKRAYAWKNILEKRYPGKKFAIYDYGYGSVTYSLPLVLYLQTAGKISDHGVKIGFGSKPNIRVQDHPEIRENTGSFVLRDLQSSSAAQLTEDGWAFINPSQIYKSTQEWTKR